MHDFLMDLPAVLVMGTLVGIFYTLLREKPSPRVRLWVAGWSLIFLRYVIAVLPHGLMPWRQIAATVAMSSMLLAGFAFVLSVSPILERGGPALTRLYIQLGLAGAILPGLYAFDVEAAWPYVICISAILFAPAIFRAFLKRPVNSPGFAIMALVFGVIALALFFFASSVPVTLFGRTFDVTVISIHGEGIRPLAFQWTLACVYFAGVVRLWRAYPRVTPGVMGTLVGFGASALMWSIVMLFPNVVTVLGRDHELWNAPKYIMAFGMIVLLLEEGKAEAEGARQRESLLNQQMQRFADVTSRLLSGVDVRAYCDEIAEMIVEVTTFSRCTILIADEHQQVQLAGHAGLDEATVDEVRDACSRLVVRDLTDVSAKGKKIGRSAVLVSAETATDVHAVRSKHRYDENEFWRDGDELIVPLRSHRGNLVGLISLDDPREVERVVPVEMTKIEMLADDIAVALENSALQRQVVQSEKLVSIGQLVAGVAHELNNPLTAVLGYSELLADQVHDEKALKEIEIIRRESLRMKQIISNLQRFAQQARTDTAETAMRPLLDEIYRSKINDLYARGIELVPDFGPSLPKVMISAAQLRQVILNLIANSVDAVGEQAEKRIRFQARSTGDAAVISIIDNGPGFTDVTRAFDPFFTTKSPGKGIGLGLSICYGVIKQHGGTISAQNLEPRGAMVAITLPAGKSETPIAGSASAGFSS